MTGWFKDNNLILNATKIKELIVDFRRKRAESIQPLHIGGDCVEIVGGFCFLGLQIKEDLSRSTNTSAVIKKAQKRLFFRKPLKKNHLSQKLLVSFYRCSVRSVLTYCVWELHCHKQKSAPEGRLQRPENYWMPSPLPG